jgi:hypothetical protein
VLSIVNAPLIENNYARPSRPRDSDSLGWFRLGPPLTPPRGRGTEAIAEPFTALGTHPRAGTDLITQAHYFTVKLRTKPQSPLASTLMLFTFFFAITMLAVYQSGNIGASRLTIS